ncbi:DUF862-domain-containing protein [Xylariomycetidae sp. FL2044]|nr:DUF862-domain-containing protein [Xylariomycetidae sp. FL2044]
MPNTNRSRRSTSSLSISRRRTEIIINVYDLLPQGRLSSILWNIGASLLHSGVVINGREYAYGGHETPGATGVYWTSPQSVPPGGTFKTEILHGFTLLEPAEIDKIIRKASKDFRGTDYNLLTNNCNHFTSYLCQKLTDKPGPSWLNRAASFGVAFPCIVPKDWIEPPSFVAANEDDDGTDARESDFMLGQYSSSRVAVDNGGEEGPQRDSSGRALPSAETAPVH